MGRRSIHPQGPQPCPKPLSTFCSVCEFCSVGHQPRSGCVYHARRPPWRFGVARETRGLLRYREDAEDTFQATFLVLARKAASLQKRPSIAGWLYQTAHHLALKSRKAASRRRCHAGQAPRQLMADPLEDITVREARSILDEELSRLTTAYREPVLLCMYEGVTQDEAARRLGCSLKTLKRRLERGRELLRQRLCRRACCRQACLL